MNLRDKVATKALRWILQHVATHDFTLKYAYALDFGTKVLAEAIQRRKEGEDGSFIIQVEVYENEVVSSSLTDKEGKNETLSR